MLAGPLVALCYPLVQLTANLAKPGPAEDEAVVHVDTPAGSQPDQL